MRSFQVAADSPQRFAQRVRDLIQERGYSDYVRCSLDDDHLVVRFRYMGRSTLRYRLQSLPEGGFGAELVEQRLSPFHAPFRAGFEARFRDVVETLGAESTAD